MANNPSAQHSRREALLSQIVELADKAIFGSLSQTFGTCGNPSCRCHHGDSKHGPHLSIGYRGGAKTAGYHVPIAAEDRVRTGEETWHAFQDCLRELADMNFQGHTCRREKKGGPMRLASMCPLAALVTLCAAVLFPLVLPASRPIEPNGASVARAALRLPKRSTSAASSSHDHPRPRALYRRRFGAARLPASISAPGPSPSQPATQKRSGQLRTAIAIPPRPHARCNRASDG